MRKEQLSLKLLAIICVSVLTMLAFAIPSVAGQNNLVRDSIPEKHKWDLSHIYPDWETWERDLVKYDSLVKEFGQLEGSICQSPENLLRAFHMRDDLGKLIDSVYTFASLSYTTAQRNNKLRAKRERARTAYSGWRIASSWFEPELLEISWEKYQSWLKGNSQLEEYEFEVKNLYRRQKHMLGKEQERLLSYFSTFQSSAAGIYNALTVADVEHPTIRLSNDEEVLLTYGNYTNLLSTNRNQDDRAMAFDTLMVSYSSRANTHAAIYDAVLQRDWAQTQARGYASTLEYYLDRDNVPPEVFENLIASVKKGAGAIRRYYRFKKEHMGLEDYHMYDRMVPIIDFDVTYEYDDITDWVIASVEPLGNDYQSKLARGFQDRWIDVYENEGKSTGGFCSGVYGVHPYVLLNYNETMGEMFTVAHEMGHAMHSVLANQNQPYATAGYSIFVAEVAAISNELLLLDYLLGKTDDPVERIFLLQHTLDGMRGTFYRQLLFADFEWRAHQLIENGQPVTAQTMNDLYMSVVEDFYGDDLVLDSLLGYYWSAVPHFHFGPYYVYKYATSYAAASHIVRSILDAEGEQRQAEVDRYLNLLKAGGSDYPMNLLEEAGVDMSDPQTYQAVITLTEELVTQLENELGRL